MIAISATANTSEYATSVQSSRLICNFGDNRATHDLLRFYTLRYCENCRAGLPEPSD
jgi:hypothetical protein